MRCGHAMQSIHIEVKTATPTDLRGAIRAEPALVESARVLEDYGHFNTSTHTTVNKVKQQHLFPKGRVKQTALHCFATRGVDYATYAGENSSSEIPSRSRNWAEGRWQASYS